MASATITDVNDALFVGLILLNVVSSIAVLPSKRSVVCTTQRQVPLESVGKRFAGTQAKRKASECVAADESDPDSHLLSDDEAQAQQSSRKMARIACPICRESVPRRGLTHMPFGVSIDEPECPLCYEEITRPSTVVTPCGHYFCEPCWKKHTDM